MNSSIITANCPASLTRHLVSSAVLGIDRSVDILEHIRSLPTDQERSDAVSKIQAIEREAMLKQQPQPGLVELMDYLESRKMRRALCTRNFECVTKSFFPFPFSPLGRYLILKWSWT